MAAHAKGTVTQKSPFEKLTGRPDSVVAEIEARGGVFDADTEPIGMTLACEFVEAEK